MAEPDICEPGGSGLFVPLFGGSAEGEWSKSLRACIYGILMCYCFLGSSIVCDCFMSAIETITGKRRRCFDEERQRMVTYFVWNDTAANLTLLALGSTAPEILLCLVEVVKLDFVAGELGPFTIVGSSAFDLLIVIAVAILSIPPGEITFIRGFHIYDLTVAFFFGGFIWLLFILQVVSKDRIEVWEAIFTVLLFVAYLACVFFVDKYQVKIERLVEQARSQKSPEMHSQPTDSLSLESEQRDEQPMDVEDSRLSYKRKSRKLLNPHLVRVQNQRQVITDNAHARISVLANERLSIGGVHGVGHVDMGDVMDNSGGLDAYERPPGFSDGVHEQLQQSPPAGDNGVCISDAWGKPIDNKQGVLTFLHDELEVKGCIFESVISVPVLRRNGSQGSVTCTYRLEPLDAVPGHDYEGIHGVRGVLFFPPGSVQQEVTIIIFPQRRSEQSESFQLVLDGIAGGAIFNPNDDGDQDSCIMTITIVNAMDGEEDQEQSGLINSCMKCYERFFDPELISYSRELWKEQIRQAFRVSANDQAEDELPTVMEHLVHVPSFPWKVIFAFLTPPPVLCGGWLLFIVCLVHLSVLTALIADLAETFACCLDLQDAVTALLVVGPSLSLPGVADLFAAQAAGTDQKYADTWIVSLTSRIPVKVFLGIGLPWTFASMHWLNKGEVGATAKWQQANLGALAEYPNGAFIVDSDSLAFSIGLVMCLCIVSLSCLRIKRRVSGGELGGGFVTRQCVAYLFVFLWIWHITWNIIESVSDGAGVGLWLSFALGTIFIFLVIGVEVGFKRGWLVCKDPSPRGPTAHEIFLDIKPLSQAVEEEFASPAMVGNPQEEPVYEEEEEPGDDLPSSRQSSPVCPSPTNMSKVASKKKKKPNGPPKRPQKD